MSTEPRVEQWEKKLVQDRWTLVASHLDSTVWFAHIPETAIDQIIADHNRSLEHGSEQEWSIGSYRDEDNHEWLDESCCLFCPSAPRRCRLQLL